MGESIDRGFFFIFFSLFCSHLVGFFYRTIRLLENGIKPVFVFDGKPPVMKGGELAKRAERREEAQKALEKAEEAGVFSELSLHLFYFCTLINFTQFLYAFPQKEGNVIKN